MDTGPAGPARRVWHWRLAPRRRTMPETLPVAGWSTSDTDGAMRPFQKSQVGPGRHARNAIDAEATAPIGPSSNPAGARLARPPLVSPRQRGAAFGARVFCSIDWS